MMKNRFHRGHYLIFCLYKRLEIKNAANGKGVFTANDIQAGETILQLGGPIFSGSEIPFLSEPVNDYFLQIGEDLYLGPSGEVDDYINHSCDPSTGLVFHPEGIALKSIVFIPAGSEITYDYSTTMDGFWGEMACSCGSIMCRGKIVNFLEIPEEVQLRYCGLGIVPSYISEKLNSAVDAVDALSTVHCEAFSPRFRERKRRRL